ncbi:MAG: SIMPL domain-containing protein [bacterium]
MKSIHAIVGIFLLCTCVTIQAQNQNFLERPYLETAATYTTEVTPDEIYLAIQISESDTRGKVSIEELEAQMIRTLNALGIDTKTQLQVADLSSDFKKYFLKKKDVVKTKNYVLIVNDAKSLAQIAYRLEQINISNISIQRTDYSKLEELKIELREKAIAKAKRQAESMLKPLDQKLGMALYISDTDNSVNRMLRGRVSGLNSSYSASESYFEFADIGIVDMRVEVSVIVFFEIL